MPLSDNARGALYMSVAMTAFTANDACMKAVTQVLPLYQAMFLRGALATLALLAIGWHMGSLRFGMEVLEQVRSHLAHAVADDLAFLRRR